jgi:5-methylcytosine-specific restriction protein A
MTRRSLTKLQRVRVFDAAGGICHLCKAKIHVGERWDVEHVKPLSMGGADDEANMAPAHVSCHRIKTSAEAGPRAKADRIRARHLGIRPKSKFPCSKDSPYRKKLDGSVVRR